MNELQALWAELNSSSPRPPRPSDVRRALTREAWALALGVLLDLLLLFWTGGFLYDHREEPRFFAPGLVLHVYLILSLVAHIAGTLLARGVDYDAPVVASQRRVAAFALLKARITQWTFLTAPLLWIPLLVVFFRGPLHVDPYRFLDPLWLIANVAFGIAFIPVALWIARRLVPRFDRSRLIGTLAGANLSAALRHYEALVAFEDERPSTPAS